MAVPIWVAELASLFWSRKPEGEAFPRSLRPVARKWSLTLKEFQSLTVGTASEWLIRARMPAIAGEACRPLHGCFSGYGGHGFIFINVSDSPEEQRFTLAHEIAHFLRDYWQPRDRAGRRFGPDILDVLDGKREPSLDEQLSGVLTGIPVGVHTHLMTRGPDMDAAEDDADRLALELLAPFTDVQRYRFETRPVATSVLRADFGLPKSAAATYAALLVPAQPGRESLVDRWRAELRS